MLTQVEVGAVQKDVNSLAFFLRSTRTEAMKFEEVSQMLSLDSQSVCRASGTRVLEMLLLAPARQAFGEAP